MANTTSGRPTSVTVSFFIWLIVVLIGIVSSIIAFTSGGTQQAASDAGVGNMGTGIAVGGAIFALVIAIVELIIVFKMRDGRNWARIVLLILAILQVLGVFGAFSITGIIGVVAVIIATILMFVGGANGYFRKR
jgi:hypothetical protein